ncbi:MAG: acetate--CoA ligase, partial [Candidatus Thermoplasmatota archaeon]|nr:acetate--CoA ligase [Candidatus Thermoplasmatota archaeon]
HGEDTAILWEGEPGDTRELSYRELHEEVCRFSQALLDLGVEKGDRVTLYLPMVPELPVAMLACARIGAIHNVVFAGFSPQALAHRMEDAGSRVLVTCDGYHRRGRIIQQKQRADEGIQLVQATTVEHVLVVPRLDRPREETPLAPERDHWLDQLLPEAVPDVPPEPMDAEDVLFMMYTSGTTGKPKGIVHTTAGYLTGVLATATWVLDLKPGDTYWCMADIGWITGHSYIVYGPLMLGAQVVLYEGAPDHPSHERPWEIIERYGVDIFYTAPTAIRAFMSQGREHAQAHDLSSLRLLGTVGEPINPEAWMWYHETIGQGRCPIVDTWWQTETGMMMLTPLPGISETVPGSAVRPFPGIQAQVLDQEGEPVPPGTGGRLALTRPWPAMLRTIWQDEERYVSTYWSTWDEATYDAGDAARIDPDGYFWIQGRLDDVLNVAGHRLGTMEIESAIVGHPQTAEAAVVGAPHDIKGQIPVAFVILEQGAEPTEELRQALMERVSKEISPIAVPGAVLFTEELPKTRSGKIMRRLLKDIVAGRELGDTTTLGNPEVATAVQEAWRAAKPA